MQIIKKSGLFEMNRLLLALALAAGFAGPAWPKMFRPTNEP
jgi:hypothetical protein